jgi:glycerophosphoryl diester phosphodiesterase
VLETFDVQAHRGGMGLRPENTLAAFAHALGLGVSALELDVRLTRDGVPVVHHDARVNPLLWEDTGPVHRGDRLFPYVGRPIARLTLAQLRTLAGAQAGERIPTLDEVAALSRPARLTVELKVAPLAGEAVRERLVQAALGELRAARALDRATVQSFSWRVLRRVRELEPGARIAALAARGGSGLVPGAAELGAAVLAPVHRATTRPLVRAAHERGLAVVPWTVNDRGRMEELVDLGVDGIITDRPDLLRAVLAGRGLAVPAPAPAHAAPAPLALAA